MSYSNKKNITIVLIIAFEMKSIRQVSFWEGRCFTWPHVRLSGEFVLSEHRGGLVLYAFVFRSLI